LLDYFTGIKMFAAGNQVNKRFWFWLSVGINLGFLGVFKYYNFFISSFADALSLIGVSASVRTLQVILPVGISFYTFHGLSYVIDIYNGRIKPERNFIDYSLFVSFFPLLVAGPIERATHLLPQIITRRVFDYSQAANGMRQILWGLFKKVVIADNCALFVNQVFDNAGTSSGSELILGSVFFAFQIYGDFSGYSDIAIGTARLFGIELLKNFAFPYFSRDIAEFWRRWHISLTTWFRDYLYIPLGGSKGGTWMKIRNTFVVFLVSGFWHGANWTFIVWGILNAIYFLPLLVLDKNRENLHVVAAGMALPTFRETFQILSTFALTCFAWIFFRAESLTDATTYIASMFANNFLPGRIDKSLVVVNAFIVAIFLPMEWFIREKGVHRVSELRPLTRYLLYFGVAIFIFLFGRFNNQEFIYFQF
jgi:D-alanyl-lipoteichoic acid acyltransferase DltB (MBOAT superfamily)